jgi:hypothetical protein
MCPTLVYNFTVIMLEYARDAHILRNCIILKIYLLIYPHLQLCPQYLSITNLPLIFWPSFLLSGISPDYFYKHLLE